MSVLKGYIDRVYRLTSECYHTETRRLIFNGLKTNGYPSRLIITFIDKFITKNILPRPTQADTEQQQPVRVSIHYINGVSECIARVFHKHTNTFKLAFKNTACVYDVLSKMKDRLDNQLRSNVIYQIKCNDCDDKVYIGITGQLLKQRISKHRSDVNNGKETCMLAQHSLNRRHSFDFDNAVILASHNSYEKLKILEKLYIISSKNCVNKKCIEAAGISPIYTHLFEFLFDTDQTRRE